MPHIEANYDKWLKLDLWKIWEGISILLGREPDQLHFLEREQAKYTDGEFWQAFNEIATMAERSISAGTLKVSFSPPNYLFRRLSPIVFLKWTINKQIKIPEPLMNLLCKTSPDVMPLNFFALGSTESVISKEPDHLNTDLSEPKEKTLEHENKTESPFPAAFELLSPKEKNDDHTKNPKINLDSNQNEFSFTKKGEYFEMMYNKATYLIKVTNGIIYIEHLLKKPNKEYSIFELRALTHKVEVSNIQEDIKKFHEDNDETGFNLDGSHHQDILDDDSIESFNSELRKIEKKLAIVELNSEKYNELITTKNWINSELHKNQYKNSSRSFNNISENIRKAVSKAIHSALKQIKDHSNDLYNFLSSRIKTESHSWKFIK